MKRARRARRNPDASATKAAVRAYSALHDGLRPERVDKVRYKGPQGYLVHLGRKHADEYYRRVDDDGDGQENEKWELYRHEYKPDAAPDYYYDRAGQLFVSGGNYKVTERGITDMRRRHRKMFGFIPRVNPDLTQGQILTRGIGLALVAVGVNKGMDTLVDPFLATDRTRSLVKTGVAGVLGLMIRKSYPFIGTGFIAAGALELIQLGYRELGIDRYEAQARDRVAAIALRMRGAAGGATSGVYGLDGHRVTGALEAPRGHGVPDPARIRQQMAMAR